MNIASPKTRKRFRSAALFFTVLAVWTWIAILSYDAIGQRQLMEQELARPSIEAMQARNAADEARNPQESQSGASGSEPRAHYVIAGATITTYQAVPEQTDSSPCTGAMAGINFCDPPFPIVANNCLELGVQVEIRHVAYTIADRLAPGTSCKVFDVLTDGENYRLTNQQVIVL